MKKVYHIFSLFVLMAVSCTQQDMEEKKQVAIIASFPEMMESKVSMTEKEGDMELALAWEDTDRIKVIGESTEIFSVQKIDGKKATFAGNEVEGAVFDVVLSTCEDVLEKSYLIQEQRGVASTSHLEYDAYLKGVDNYTDVEFTPEWAQAHGGELLQSGCLLLYFKIPEGKPINTVTRVNLESTKSVFHAGNSGSDAKASKLTLNIRMGNVGTDGIVKAYMTTPMLETMIDEGTSLRLTIETDNGVFVKDFTPGKVSFMPGKRNVIKLNSKNWKPLKESRNVTLMTYNVGKFEKYIGDIGHYSYEETAQIMKHYGIDIVGLNETYTPRYGFLYDNQAEKVASAMGSGWTCYFAQAKADNLKYYGNSIVSSPEYAIRAGKTVELPCTANTSNPDGNYETRSLGVVEYDDFVFCVTHLDHNNKENRLQQIEVINDWIEENYGSYNKPVFLTGDMNTTPGAPEITTGFGAKWKVISVTRQADSKDYVVTYPGTGKCLDYIFILKNDKVEYMVNKTEVVTSCPGVDVNLVSDHLPVYVDITFVRSYPENEIMEEVQGSIDRLPNTSIYEEEF